MFRNILFSILAVVGMTSVANAGDLTSFLAEKKANYIIDHNSGTLYLFSTGNPWSSSKEACKQLTDAGIMVRKVVSVSFTEDDSPIERTGNNITNMAGVDEAICN